MFPIRDHNPATRPPIVTYSIIAICCAVWIYEVMLGASLNNFFDTFALTPAEVSSGTELYTLITSMFLHGGWMHILGNMLFLKIFGDNLEDRMGHIKFLLFYLGTGLIASAAHIVTEPASQIPTVGASGAIAGVMGAYLLLYPKARIDMFYPLGGLRLIPVPAVFMLGYWFVAQLFSGVGSLAMSAGGGGVAYWAHIGGFIAGLIWILPWKKTPIKLVR